MSCYCGDDMQGLVERIVAQEETVKLTLTTDNLGYFFFEYHFIELIRNNKLEKAFFVDTDGETEDDEDSDEDDDLSDEQATKAIKAMTRMSLEKLPAKEEKKSYLTPMKPAERKATAQTMHPLLANEPDDQAGMKLRNGTMLQGTQSNKKPKAKAINSDPMTSLKDEAEGKSESEEEKTAKEMERQIPKEDPPSRSEDQSTQPKKFDELRPTWNKCYELMGRIASTTDDNERANLTKLVELMHAELMHEKNQSSRKKKKKMSRADKVKVEEAEQKLHARAMTLITKHIDRAVYAGIGRDNMSNPQRIFTAIQDKYRKDPDEYEAVMFRNLRLFEIKPGQSIDAFSQILSMMFEIIESVCGNKVNDTVKYEELVNIIRRYRGKSMTFKTVFIAMDTAGIKKTYEQLIAHLIQTEKNEQKLTNSSAAEQRHAQNILYKKGSSYQQERERKQDRRMKDRKFGGRREEVMMAAEQPKTKNDPPQHKPQQQERTHYQERKSYRDNKDSGRGRAPGRDGGRGRGRGRGRGPPYRGGEERNTYPPVTASQIHQRQYNGSTPITTTSTHRENKVQMVEAFGEDDDEYMEELAEINYMVKREPINDGEGEWTTSTRLKRRRGQQSEIRARSPIVTRSRAKRDLDRHPPDHYDARRLRYPPRQLLYHPEFDRSSRYERGRRLAERRRRNRETTPYLGRGPAQGRPSPTSERRNDTRPEIRVKHDPNTHVRNRTSRISTRPFVDSQSDSSTEGIRSFKEALMGRTEMDNDCSTIQSEPSDTNKGQETKQGTRVADRLSSIESNVQIVKEILENQGRGPQTIRCIKNTSSTQCRCAICQSQGERDTLEPITNNNALSRSEEIYIPHDVLPEGSTIPRVEEADNNNPIPLSNVISIANLFDQGGTTSQIPGSPLSSLSSSASSQIVIEDVQIATGNDTQRRARETTPKEKELGPSSREPQRQTSFRIPIIYRSNNEADKQKTVPIETIRREIPPRRKERDDPRLEACSHTRKKCALPRQHEDGSQNQFATDCNALLQKLKVLERIFFEDLPCDVIHKTASVYSRMIASIAVDPSGSGNEGAYYWELDFHNELSKIAWGDLPAYQLCLGILMHRLLTKTIERAAVPRGASVMLEEMSLKIQRCLVQTLKLTETYRVYRAGSEAGRISYSEERSKRSDARRILKILLHDVRVSNYCVCYTPSKTDLKCFSECKKALTKFVCKQLHLIVKNTIPDYRVSMVFMTLRDIDGASGDPPEDLILDTGATIHLFRNPSLVFNIRKKKTKIRFANDEIAVYDRVGTAGLLDDIVLSDHVQQNIVSGSQLGKRGLTVNISPEITTITDQDGCVISTGNYKADGLIHLNDINLLSPCAHFIGLTLNDHVKGDSPSRSKTMNRGIDPLLALHNRLGHVNEGDLKEMVRSGNVDGCQVTFEQIKHLHLEPCDTCMRAKMRRMPVKESAHKKDYMPMEKIGSDVAGKISIMSLQGNRFFIIYVDYKTGYVVPYFVARKSDLIRTLTDFERGHVNKNGHKLKVLQSDSEAIYKDESINRWCRKRGVTQQFSPSYFHQANGKAERTIKSIVEMARAMMISSRTPSNLWEFAVQYAAEIRNRLPRNKLNMLSPYEVVTGVRPDISAFLPFYSDGWTYLYPDERVKGRKFDPVSVRCNFLGYPEEHKNAFLIRLANGRITTRRDCRFSEHVPDPHPAVTTPLDGLDPRDIQQAEGRKLSKTKSYPTTTSRNRDQYTEQEESSDYDELPFEPIAKRLTRERRKTSILNLLVEKIYSCTTTPAVNTEDIDSPTNIPTPSNCRQALHPKNKYSEQWREAIRKEMDEMLSRGSIVDVSMDEVYEAGRRPFQSKWVFKVKIEPDGSVKFKARLVAKGFTQIKGEDYDGVYSATPNYSSVTMLLHIAAVNNWIIIAVDIANAYQEAKADHLMFMQLPMDYTNGIPVAVRLDGNINGTKQGALLWANLMEEVLLKFGFKKSKIEPCLFHLYREEKELHVLVYVDDILITGNSQEEIDGIIKHMESNFKRLTMQTNVKKFLGIRLNITQRNDYKEIFLHQEEYIDEITKDMELPVSKGTPLPTCVAALKVISGENVEPMHKEIGQIRFAADRCRPDIGFAASLLARSAANADIRQIDAMKRTMGYLKDTRSLGIRLGGPDKEIKLFGISDASFANEKDSKAQLCYCLFLSTNSGTVLFKSWKDKSVTTSTTQSEIHALFEMTKTIIWYREILKEFNLEQKLPTPLFEDNMNVVNIGNQSAKDNKSRFYLNKINLIREAINEGMISLNYIETENNVADIGTKSLQLYIFEYLREKLLSGVGETIEVLNKQMEQ